MTQLSIPSVLLNLNPAQITTTDTPAGSAANLQVNGTFQISGSLKTLGYYNNNFPLSASDLTASLSDINTLAISKVKIDLGL